MLDIFEILGPIMVGPSSSHTAGAVRIGRMARLPLFLLGVAARRLTERDRKAGRGPEEG